MAIERYKQRKYLHALLRKVFYNKTLIDKNHRCRSLVILHLFYEKSWTEINEYLKNLSPYSFDLIVTATKDHISQTKLNHILEEYPRARIMVTENRDFDLLPFLRVLKDVDLDKYDIVFKLQSKSNKRMFIHIYKQLFLRRDWFVNLYEGILSAKNVHRTIDVLYNQGDIGLVAATNLIVKDPKHKVNLIKKIAEKGVYYL